LEKEDLLERAKCICDDDFESMVNVSRNREVLAWTVDFFFYGFKRGFDSFLVSGFFGEEEMG